MNHARNTLSEALALPKSRPPYTVADGAGVSHIASALGIRLSYLDPNIHQNLRADDVFQLQFESDGSAKLVQLRGQKNTHMRIYREFSLPREAIFQDIEAGPNSFPHIHFIRNESDDTYTIANRNGLTDITISTANLDHFRKAVDKISGPLITECGSRTLQYELACEIEPHTDG